ncbi:hypothetical protein SS1G_09792 [Sclerotinia sclerotiorum 1980 UF-70]|uniref:Uncharacterized protein n=1 Tax=Sclerotinia sclerotiorum (strain ATCC 18683 / 1980 / Ss-1) TaxID=665079 RepID=A7EWT3_SCLS1|nr:hypothetical protein SS1G_09792 [Sclerotinia sclerotiorum 1980 UF-70]EDN93925.1 hypothetical protein SS1G_09792 [Sclerotinia sclerotiorum 1980 UF-70]
MGHGPWAHQSDQDKVYYMGMGFPPGIYGISKVILRSNQDNIQLHIRTTNDLSRITPNEVYDAISRLNVTTTNEVSLLDKTTTKANKLWNSWEKKDSGWQKKVVEFGNKALKRIPYEEWGLKSVPPLSKRRQEEELSDKEKVEVSFPSTFLPRERVLEILEILGTERKQLHKTRLWGSIIGMPIVAPFALVPMNKIPFPDPRCTTPTKSSKSKVSNVETMLLHASDGKRIAKALDIPELQMELDRAVWQVENDLEAKRKLGEEKEQLGRSEEKGKKK